MDLVRIAVRAVTAYLFLLACVRWSGKRTIRQSSPFDFVLALVIGIARENNARELREQGADLVVTDLGETSVDDIDRLIRAKRAAAGDFQLPRDGNGSAHK